MIGDVRAKASIEGEVQAKTIIADANVGRITVVRNEAETYNGEYVVTTLDDDDMSVQNN